MKRFIVLWVFFIPSLLFAQKARIEFFTTSHNFGTISEKGGNVTVDFNFKNTGKVPLILRNVRSGCGCTILEWDKRPVAPGDTSSIKVAFDPLDRPGTFVKSIAVNSNASNSVVTLTIRGNVSREPAGPYDAYKYDIDGIKLTGKTIQLGTIIRTQVVERQIEMINSNQQPATIQTSSASPHLKVQAEPTTLAKNQKGTITLQYDASQKDDWGFVTDKIQVKVNDHTEGNIIVAATLSEDFSQYKGDFSTAPIFSLSENEYVMNNLETNHTYHHEFYIQNTGQSELIIRKINTSDENISVNTSKKIIKPGKKVKVHVSLTTGKAEKMIKIIQFITNDPQNSSVTYQITGHLK